jgi:molybdate transport repressor ModE-like protein
VAVPPGSDPKPVRGFDTFTEDLLKLRDWLLACDVQTVAMESTGVYWIALFQILEAAGLEVCLVNARHCKNLPGRKTGSINKAARRMGMSYMRAWSLVQTMNRCFKKPIVCVTHGGEGGGGAELTETGCKVAALYEQMEQASLRATAAPWKQLRRLLRV